MESFLRKMDGLPAAIMGVVFLAIVAYLVARSFSAMEEEKASLIAELAASQEKTASLVRVVEEREQTISDFQNQLGELTSTVGTLEKLANTDEELLKKYSKIYFLNENYVPAKLIKIDPGFLSPGATNVEIHSQVWPYLERLLIAADKAGVKLLVASAYRSFATQSALKSSYKITYGSGANSFSADQGYSEHQLGTAVDFTSRTLGANFSSFASDPAYKWLLSNAHHYGFVLSYSQNNAYYKFEPWHWRFVGVNLASRLRDDNRHFYDMDQREIDRYLIKLFD